MCGWVCTRLCWVPLWALEALLLDHCVAISVTPGMSLHALCLFWVPFVGTSSILGALQGPGECEGRRYITLTWFLPFQKLPCPLTSLSYLASPAPCLDGIHYLWCGSWREMGVQPPAPPS